MPKLFTPEDVKTLRDNPYTYKVSHQTIFFTLEFKELFWQGYQEGRSTTQLLHELGYDPDVLGEARVAGISRHIRDQANSEMGLRQGIARRSKPHLAESDMKGLTQNQAMKQMQREIIYLRQELEFVKKIIARSNGKGSST
jgi:hypothetical protein